MTTITTRVVVKKTTPLTTPTSGLKKANSQKPNKTHSSLFLRKIYSSKKYISRTLVQLTVIFF